MIPAVQAARIVLVTVPSTTEVTTPAAGNASIATQMMTKKKMVKLHSVHCRAFWVFLGRIAVLRT